MYDSYEAGFMSGQVAAYFDLDGTLLDSSSSYTAYDPPAEANDFTNIGTGKFVQGLSSKPTFLYVIFQCPFKLVPIQLSFGREKNLWSIFS